jgi:hypothetical protein
LSSSTTALHRNLELAIQLLNNENDAANHDLCNLLNFREKTKA